MGTTHRDPREFARDFKKEWMKVHVLYPQAKIEFVRGGVRLHPSPTHVASRALPSGG
jgi:hypothetical protein